jgi:hypothetical protein
MPPQPGDALAREDEMLELLYWLEGEKLAGRTATAAGLQRFLGWDEPLIVTVLERLGQRGYLTVADDSNEYRLTAPGRAEAARRFADDFASLLRQGHGECNDPDCECHTNPAAAAECHAERARGTGSSTR